MSKINITNLYNLRKFDDSDTYRGTEYAYFYIDKLYCNSKKIHYELRLRCKKDNNYGNPYYNIYDNFTSEQYKNYYFDISTMIGDINTPIEEYTPLSLALLHGYDKMHQIILNNGGKYYENDYDKDKIISKMISYINKSDDDANANDDADNANTDNANADSTDNKKSQIIEKNIKIINVLYDLSRDMAPEYYIYVVRLLFQYSKYFYNKIVTLLDSGLNLKNGNINNETYFSYAIKGLSAKTGDERIISLLHQYDCDYPNIYYYKRDQRYNYLNREINISGLITVIHILTEENKSCRKEISDLTAVVNALVEKVREIDFRPPHRGNAEYEAANREFDTAKTDLESQKN